MTMEPEQHWSSGLETGALVELTHVGSGHRFQALVERKAEAHDAVRPYERLRVALNGHVAWATAAAKFAALQVDDAADDELLQSTAGTGGASSEGTHYVHLRPVAHQKKLNRDETLGWHLGVDAATATTSTSSSDNPLIGNAARGPASLFALSIVSRRGAFAIDPTRTPLLGGGGGGPALHELLSDTQRRSFMREGFLQIRDVVPMRLVNAALRRINHELGVPGRMIDGGVEGQAKLAGNVSNSAAILDLLEASPARDYAQALIGPGRVAPVRGGQIALRFPELGPPREPLGTEWHTDGMRQGRRHPFTLLVGVTLSDTREPLAGNLTVFPGSHRRLHRRLRADGTLEGHADACFKAASVWGEGTLPDLGRPVPLLAHRGDLVLAHPDLAHRGGLNFGPDIRYQVYFRLKHVDHEQLQGRIQEDQWADLEGLHHLRRPTAKDQRDDNDDDDDDEERRL